jgi:hypothetical protein
MGQRHQFALGQLLLGFAMSMVLADSALRLIEVTPLWRILPVVEPILGAPDKDVGFETTPGASGVWPIEHRARVHINALGLRDIERTVAKPPGAIRIGLIGDSMTEAAQVGQQATFSAITERQLQAQGQHTEVINLAMAGPNPIRQLLRLEKRGYGLHLDLVIANASADSFTAGLLLDDSENPAYAEADDGMMTRSYGFRRRFSQRYADTVVEHVFVALYQHSPLFRMLYLRSKEPWRQLLGLTTGNGPPRAVQTVAPERAVVCRAVGLMLDPHLRLWRDHKPEHYWAATTQFLDDLADSAHTHSVRIIYTMRDIALAPSDCASEADQRANLIAIMAAEFGKRDMQFVDWNDAVAKVAGPNLERLHGFGIHRGAGHLNYEGHRAWAAALLNTLGPREQVGREHRIR